MPPAKPVVSVSRNAQRVGGTVGDGSIRKPVQQVGRQLGQIGDIHAAVPAMALPKLLGLEVLAVRRAHHFAADQLFDEAADGAAGRAAAARRPADAAYLRSIRARRRRRTASCSWISSIRFFFAQYSGSAAVYSRGTLRNKRLFFLSLAALLLATRLCYLRILWEGDSYPLAAAGQMLRGKALYRDIWFDKPPLLAVAYLLFGAAPGWPLRLADAIYVLAACWVAWRFARDLWTEREGLWAAALLGFFLCFDFPSAVIPLASDLLMLAPHLAAVWLAFRRRAFWSGAMAGVAFWINPKGLVVAAACGLWFPGGIPLMVAGFASVSAVVLAWLAGTGALAAY